MFVAALFIIAKNWKQWINTDKHTVAYPNNGTRLSNEKEQTTETRHDMDESQRPRVEWTKPASKGCVLYESIYVEHTCSGKGKTLGMGTRWMAAKAYRKGRVWLLRGSTTEFWGVMKLFSSRIAMQEHDSIHALKLLKFYTPKSHFYCM